MDDDSSDRSVLSEDELLRKAVVDGVVVPIEVSDAKVDIELEESDPEVVA